MFSWWFSWSFRIINVYQCLYSIYYLMKWIGDPDMKKKHFLKHHFNGINTSLFLKKCYQWLKLITCSYTCREYTVEKKMIMCKKDEYPLRESSIKLPHFYCKRRSRFIFIHLMLKKSFKRFITEYISDVRTIIS